MEDNLGLAIRTTSDLPYDRIQTDPLRRLANLWRRRGNQRDRPEQERAVNYDCADELTALLNERDSMGTVRKRRIVKTLVWSLIAFAITVFATYIVTGCIIKAGTTGLACRAMKIPTYYGIDSLFDWLWPVHP